MSFNKFLSVVLLAVIIMLFLQLTNCSPLAIAAGRMPPESSEFVSIGADVTRVDDNEKGVSCYIIDGFRGISCVKTK